MERKTVGIADLKARLSEHLREVRGGNEIVVVDRGRPVAKVLPMQSETNSLVLREPRKEFAGFPFARRGKGKTNSLELLLEDRNVR